MCRGRWSICWGVRGGAPGEKERQLVYGRLEGIYYAAFFYVGFLSFTTSVLVCTRGARDVV